MHSIARFVQTTQSGDGVTEGATNGATEGATNGETEGATNGATEGATNGETEGATEGAAGKADKGAIDEEAMGNEVGGAAEEEVKEGEARRKFIALWAYMTTEPSTCCDGSTVQSTLVIGSRLPAWLL
ncbi:hypothetical protein G6F57_007043 [Rhizopus arrhizus]|uniref:Uncharacterized protein n=1 Tax=Rhizopus oryzae TaxID=64495 RepID=A0A9P6X7N1_RHIOR|nr:hypothetical protein G6F30_002789 [Rhizopus arrhizus]KAG1411508.1 hypothetical protein G6F58_008519 [Rhizopus delemar]KAG0979858.1 hypothetical protein G6F29_008259 [Rhizopus arrhizus]KAG0992318.1 hypothetical protein G6F28_007752 [Rhizopus arrhizus]KAG1006366.1 hypothetical protein G6F27_008370 [Rhizopus arrhizus]